MKKQILFLAFAACLVLPITAKGAGAKNQTEKSQEDTMKNQTEAKRLGGLSPEDALSYMKRTENIVIVEVNTDYWKLKTGFIGALHIPHDQIEKRYNEIPRGVPVILHCGAGVVSVPAYEILCEKRPDIPELSYIAGRPPVSEYNEWFQTQKKN